MAEYRIVCQPFLDSFADKLETHRSGATGSSYDFLEIGCLPDCHKYRVEFNLIAREKQVELKLHRIPASTGRTVAPRSTAIVLGSFPVQVQPGSGNLLIQLDHDELNKQIREAFNPYVEYSYRENDSDDLPDAEDLLDADDTDGDGDSDEDDDQQTSSSTPVRTAARTSSPRATASNATASNAVGNTTQTPAPDSSSSMSETSSTSRRTFASKDTTRRATESAFRSSNVVSRKVTSNGRAGSGATGAERRPTPGAIVGQANRNPSNKNESSYGQASSSRNTAPQSIAASAQSSASASKKRADPPEADDPRPQKRAHVGGEPSSRTNVARGQNTAPRESSEYRGTAFLGRQNSTTPNANPDHGAARRSTDRPSFDLRAPSRRAPVESFTFSDRHREGGSGFPSSFTARRNPRNNIILGRNVPAPPRQSREGSAAPELGPSSAVDTTFRDLTIRGPRPARGSPSGRGPNSAATANGVTAARSTPTSGARPTGSTRPASGSHSVRTSGPARSSGQHPSTFNGFSPANQSQGPRTSD